MTQRKDLDAAEIDTVVGDRIRRRRILLGFTQDQLGEALGISYQQIQKYETGANRVSAGRLFQIAERLQTHVGWFFEGIGDQNRSDDSEDDDMSSPRHVIELVRGFSKITEDRLRMAVLSLVRALADTPDAESTEGMVQETTAQQTNGAHTEQPQR
ncbi:MAG: helix-turn-helix transcriptional regulator [Pseudomonadota bacterium]